LFDYLKHFEIKLVLTFDILLLAKQQLKNVILIFDKVIWDNNNAFLQWINNRFDLVGMCLIDFHFSEFQLIIFCFSVFLYLNLTEDAAPDYQHYNTKNKVHDNSLSMFPRFFKSDEFVDHAKEDDGSVEQVECRDSSGSDSLQEYFWNETHVQTDGRQHDYHIYADVEGVVWVCEYSAQLEKCCILLEPFDEQQRYHHFDCPDLRQNQPDKEEKLADPVDNLIRHVDFIFLSEYHFSIGNAEGYERIYNPISQRFQLLCKDFLFELLFGFIHFVWYCIVFWLLQFTISIVWTISWGQSCSYFVVAHFFQFSRCAIFWHIFIIMVEIILVLFISIISYDLLQFWDFWPCICVFIFFDVDWDLSLFLFIIQPLQRFVLGDMFYLDWCLLLFRNVLELRQFHIYYVLLIKFQLKIKIKMKN